MRQKYDRSSPRALRCYRSLAQGSQVRLWGQKYEESSPKAQDPIRFSASPPAELPC